MESPHNEREDSLPGAGTPKDISAELEQSLSEDPATSTDDPKGFNQEEGSDSGEHEGTFEPLGLPKQATEQESCNNTEDGKAVSDSKASAKPRQGSLQGLLSALNDCENDENLDNGVPSYLASVDDEKARSRTPVSDDTGSRSTPLPILNAGEIRAPRRVRMSLLSAGSADDATPSGVSRDNSEVLVARNDGNVPTGPLGRSDSSSRMLVPDFSATPEVPSDPKYWPENIKRRREKERNRAKFGGHIQGIFLGVFCCRTALVAVPQFCMVVVYMADLCILLPWTMALFVYDMLFLIYVFITIVPLHWNNRCCVNWVIKLKNVGCGCSGSYLILMLLWIEFMLFGIMISFSSLVLANGWCGVGPVVSGLVIAFLRLLTYVPALATMPFVQTYTTLLSVWTFKKFKKKKKDRHMNILPVETGTLESKRGSVASTREDAGPGVDISNLFLDVGGDNNDNAGIAARGTSGHSYV